MLAQMQRIGNSQVTAHQYGTGRVTDLHAASKFAAADPNETTLQYLDRTRRQTAGGRAETAENIRPVGSWVLDSVAADWAERVGGVPPIPTPQPAGFPAPPVPRPVPRR